MTQASQSGLHRRSLISLAPAIVIAGCSRSASADNTYAVVDTSSEIALAPDGSRCAIQSTSIGINTILLIRSDFSDATLLSLPEKNFWVRDVSFGEDADHILFSAGAPEFGGFDTNIRLYRLNLARGGAQPIPTSYDFNRVPTISPTGHKLAFAGRSNGGASLCVYERDLADGTVTQYSPVPFQSIQRMAYRSDGTLVVNGTPGFDPFDTTKIDEANGFQRVFLLGRSGAADPSPFMALGAKNLALHGVNGDQVFLSARYDAPSGVADIRVALMDGDLSTHRFIDFPEMKGRTITGATIASRSGLMAARGVDVTDVDRAGFLVIKDFGNALISDLAARATRHTIVL